MEATMSKYEWCLYADRMLHCSVRNRHPPYDCSDVAVYLFYPEYVMQ
jgi:hypothetical protein